MGHSNAPLPAHLSPQLVGTQPHPAGKAVQTLIPGFVEGEAGVLPQSTTQSLILELTGENKRGEAMENPILPICPRTVDKTGC